MNKYKYIKADAFSSANSLGNPAACLYLAKDQTLTDAQMLTVAKHHKGFVSEVVFCKDIDHSSYELVYFSSECEVSFCGHGTIACLYPLIKNIPELRSLPELWVHTRRKGPLLVYNKITDYDGIFISAPAPIQLEIPVSVEEIADSLQTTASVIAREYPIDFIDAGNRTLIVPFFDFNQEVTLSPDEQRLKQFSLANNIDVVLIFCRDTENKTHFVHTRVFAAKYGYLEDPATGSANAALGYYLLKNTIWDGHKISIEQGGQDRVFNTVHLCTENKRLLFGGSAATRIEGFYYI
ncbi:MAG: PhzF family phenazine biosynthesis isomerase [Gracilibacteraceae bacterium]|jgi:PhzF family phenazine biosynthesis protein|nr:PhzF family phenazine biosynthesis isomerase [Gracilibacteraceae bacterium]